MAPGSREKVAVVWFKSTDLRTLDHEPLCLAHATGLPVLHLFIFDERWFRPTALKSFPRTSPRRVLFQLQALQDLSAELEAAGHCLAVRRGRSTAAVFRELCEDFEVEGVYACNEVCSEELRVEESVRQVLLRAKAGPLRLSWAFELHRFTDLPEAARRKGAGGFSGWRRIFEQCKIPEPLAKPELAASKAVRWGRAEGLPAEVKALGLEAPEAPDARAEVAWRGGEKAGLARVEDYFFQTDAVGLEFTGATNFPHEGNSSTRPGSLTKLSPWLAHGCLSARWLLKELRRYEAKRGRTDCTSRLLHELYFRDFVRFSALQKGSRIFRLEGLYGKHPAGGWRADDAGYFEAWREGQTGFPFVDAAMRELKATGHCSHAGREVAAWFLVADLGLDWRLGAEWFEASLLDYEAASNWFNWAFTIAPRATGGNAIQEEAMPHAPPRTRLQTPEVVYWAAQHDPDAEYVKRWLPELQDLSAAEAREPWRCGAQGEAVPGAERERPPAVSREKERIGWVRRSFPAGGPAVLLWWHCARELRRDPKDGEACDLPRLRSKYGASAEDYWRGQCQELRLDPADGGLYSLEAMVKRYEGTYSKKEVAAYFEQSCTKGGRPSAWPQSYALPLLPPASLADMEAVAEQSRRNQARRALKAAKLRQHWAPAAPQASAAPQAPEAGVSEAAVSEEKARGKRWARK